MFFENKNFRWCIAWFSLDFGRYINRKNKIYVFLHKNLFWLKTTRKEPKHLNKHVNDLKKNTHTQKPEIKNIPEFEFGF
jgi:hypothetical protein